MIGHSSGSIVACETVAATPGHEVRALVSQGSQLGIANLIFDELDPAPRGGLGAWPGSHQLPGLSSVTATRSSRSRRICNLGSDRRAYRAAIGEACATDDSRRLRRYLTATVSAKHPKAPWDRSSQVEACDEVITLFADDLGNQHVSAPGAGPSKDQP